MSKISSVVRGRLAGVPDPEREPVIKPKVLADLAQVSIRTIYAAVERGEIPSVRLGRRIVIPTRDALVVLGLLPADVQPPSPVVPAEVVDRIARYRAAGMTASAVAAALSADNIPAPDGKPWSRSLVDAVSSMSMQVAGV